MTNIKIREQGCGQWPTFFVAHDWAEAWTVRMDSDRAVIQICGDDQ